MILKINNFLFTENQHNWKIFLLMPLVSLLDLGALYLFTQAVTGEISDLSILVSVIAFYAINLIVQIFSIGFFAHYSYSIVQRKFSALFYTVLNQTPDKRRSDDYLQNFFSVEYFRICERILLPFIVIVSKGLTAIIVFVFVLIQDPIIILSFGMLIILLYFLIFKFIRPQIDKANILINNSIEKINYSINLLNSYKFESKVYNITSELLSGYSLAQKVYVSNSAKLQKWSSIPRPIVEFFVYFGITFVLTNNQILEIEKLLVIGMGCLKIITAIQTVYYSLTTIRGNISALDKFLALKKDARFEENTDGDNLLELDAHSLYPLEVSGYLRRREILVRRTNTSPDFNFVLNKGEKCAIVGSSGVGKTSLLLSLLGLSNNVDVELNVKGVDATPNQLAIKELFGFVPQYPVVFNGTLRDNLNFFTYSDDSVLQDIVEKLDLRESDGQLFSLDKTLSLKGNNISGGQAHRICFARAILAKREILLLDEVTSSLDGCNSDRIISLVRDMSDLTVLWVTHDPKVIDAMDRTINIHFKQDREDD